MGGKSGASHISAIITYTRGQRAADCDQESTLSLIWPEPVKITRETPTEKEESGVEEERSDSKLQVETVGGEGMMWGDGGEEGMMGGMWDDGGEKRG